MPITTIPFSARKAGPYMATAGQTEFSFGFPVFAAGDLTVWRERAGVVTQLLLTTHYTVAGIREQGGGQVMLTTGSLEDDIIAIDGTLDPERATSFIGGTPFKTVYIDSDFNRLAIMVQELAREVGRAIRRTAVDENAGSLMLPQVFQTMLLGLNASGELLGLSALDTLGSPVVVDQNGNISAVMNLTQSGYHDLTEILAPANPPANVARLYAFDNGGVTKLAFKDSAGRVRLLDQHVFNVRDYGALVDGSTIDSVAVQNACDACEAVGGGVVWVPPTGAACVCSDIELGEGVFLMGARSKNFQGATASLADWTASGSWIHSPDTVNPTINLLGHGSGVIGLNFIRTQPTPGVGAYTPTIYPYEIKVVANLFTVEDVMTVATTHDIHVAYTDPSGGGAYSRICNIASGALVRGIKFDCVNDTLYLSNIRIRGLWYASTQSLVNYILGNLVGFDIGTLDNPQMYGVEFFHCHTAMLFTNQTVQGNTHSLVGAQAHGIFFNLCRYAMRVVSDAVVTGTFTDVSAQGATTESIGDTLFLLNSNAINLNFNGLRVAATGGRVTEVGGGASGTVFIDGLDVESYSGITASSVAMLANAGAKVSIGHPWAVESAFGITPGAIFSGTGIVDFGGGQRVKEITGSSYTILSTDNGALLVFNSGSPQAITLPRAVGKFGVGFSVEVEGQGTGGAVITPTTSTINAGATLTINSGQGCKIVSDGVNYRVQRGMGSQRIADITDYQKGTWTPGISFGGGATGLTYVSRSGTYTRVGDLAIVTFDIRLSAKGSSTGAAIITGLPFEVGAAISSGVLGQYFNMSSITGAITISASPGSNVISLKLGGTSGCSDMAEANFNNNSILVGTITYKLDE